MAIEILQPQPVICTCKARWTNPLFTRGPMRFVGREPNPECLAHGKKVG